MASKDTHEHVGIEVAGAMLRVAVARHDNDGYAVRATARTLPTGCVVSDFVVRADLLAEALREALADLDVRSAHASMALRGERTVCRVEPLAVEDDRHALAASEERLQRYVAFAGKPISIARSFQRATDQEHYAGRLISAAAARSLVERHVAVAARCGVTVTRVEPGLAMAARALMASDADPAPRFLLLAGRSRCEVAILRAGKLIFSRGVRVLEEQNSEEVWLLNVLERLQEYHLRHTNGPSLIQEVLCCGDLEPLRGALELAGRAGLRVRELDPLNLPSITELEVHGPPRPATTPRAEFFTVAGAALAPELDEEVFPGLNLLPAPERKRARVLLEPWVLAPLLLVFALTCGLLAWEWFARREATTLTYLVTHPTPQMLEAARLQLLESKLKERARNIRTLLEATSRRPAAEFLDDLARHIPPGAWLDRVRVAPEGACQIDGTAQEEDAVFAFASLLRRSPLVLSVRIARTGSTRDGGLILTDFSIELMLAPVNEPHNPKAEKLASDNQAREATKRKEIDRL